MNQASNSPFFVQEPQSSPRLQLALELIKQGSSGKPVQSHFEGLTRALTGALGGFQAGQIRGDQEEKEKSIASTLAKAFAAPSPVAQGNGELVQAAGTQTPEQALAENPLTANYALQLKLSDLASQRSVNNALQLERAKAGNKITVVPAGGTAIDESGNPLALGQPKRPAMRPLTEDERKSYGLPPGMVAAIDDTGKIQVLSKPDTLSPEAVAQQKDIAGYKADLRPPAQEPLVAVEDPNNPGTFIYAPRSQAVGAKAPAPKSAAMNEQQSNAALYADRMAEANNIIGVAGPEAVSPTQKALGSIPGVGNYLVSKDYQKLEQAQRDFVNATLRRESGAAISASEFDSAKKQYFPQPGDGPETVAQKAKNRQTAIDGIGRAAGPLYKPKGAAPAPNNAAAPSVDALVNKYAP